MKELSGFDQKVPTGHFDGYFLKVFTMYLVGFEWAICFRNHHELTMYLLGKCPLAPSEIRQQITSRSTGRLIDRSEKYSLEVMKELNGTSRVR